MATTFVSSVWCASSTRQLVAGSLIISVTAFTVADLWRDSPVFHLDNVGVTFGAAQPASATNLATASGNVVSSVTQILYEIQPWPLDYPGQSALRPIAKVIAGTALSSQSAPKPRMRVDAPRSLVWRAFLPRRHVRQA